MIKKTYDVNREISISGEILNEANIGNSNLVLTGTNCIVLLNSEMDGDEVLDVLCSLLDIGNLLVENLELTMEVDEFAK